MGYLLFSTKSIDIFRSWIVLPIHPISDHLTVTSMSDEWFWGNINANNSFRWSKTYRRIDYRTHGMFA